MYKKRKNKLNETEKQIADIVMKIFEDPTFISGRHLGIWSDARTE